MSRSELIEAARGDRPLDLLIKNVNLINVFTTEIYPADIGIYGERIALVRAGRFNAAGGKREHRRHGQVGRARLRGHAPAHRKQHGDAGQLCRGGAAAGHDCLRDRPARDRQRAGHGRRALHGRGQRRAAPCACTSPFPTCVPAVPGKETAGAEFTAKEIAEMFTWPRVIAAAEVMDYIGVVQGQPAHQRHCDGCAGRGRGYPGAFAAAGRARAERLPGGRHRKATTKSAMGTKPSKKSAWACCRCLKLSSFGNPVKDVYPGHQGPAFPGYRAVHGRHRTG